MLTAEQIKTATAKRRRTDDCEVPELGGSILLRALPAGDLVHLEHEKRKALLNGGDPDELAFEYIARSWIDDAGALLFAVEEGIATAKDLDEDSYKRLVVKIARLNGIGEQEIKQAVEDAAKN